MNITFAQLLVGFTSALTMQELADLLGVSEKEVRARLRALTPEEEREIDQALGLV
jgi:DNA-binding Lrp family transcriptional regulator